MQKRIIKYSLIAFKVVGDLLIINISLIIAYFIKFKLYLFNNYFGLNITMVNPAAQFEPYLSILAIYSLLMMFAFHFSDIYKLRYGIFAEIDEFLKILKGATIGLLEVMAFTFIYKKFPGSRYVLLYSSVMIVFLMSLYHLLLINFQKKLRARGLGSQSVLIVGVDDTAQNLAERIIKNPSSGMHLLGFIDESPARKISYNIEKYYNYLGNFNDFNQILSKGRVNKLIVAKEDVSRETLEEWYALCDKHGIEFLVMPDYLDLVSTTVTISDMDGIPIIAIRNIRRSWMDDFNKRFLDLMVAISAIIIASPVLLIFYLLIKLTSKGPAIYRQERIGKDGRPFFMYKFRSMRVDAEQHSGPKIVTASGDDRITFIGKLMRKFSIDELPQMFNVFKGDMSIVGPRPERDHFIEQFEQMYPGFSKRLMVKPGITGWAQINGRSALSSRIEEKLRYDLYYIENWSIVLDIKIICKTILKVVFASEAY